MDGVRKDLIAKGELKLEWISYAKISIDVRKDLIAKGELKLLVEDFGDVRRQLSERTSSQRAN